MTPKDRFLAALQGEPLDRPAFSLWRHFHDQDATPEGLAEATLTFAKRWKPDFVKHTPMGLYAIEDWGASIRRFEDPHRAPELSQATFPDTMGWSELSSPDVQAGALGRELQGLKLVQAGLTDDTPILMTIFSPLTLAFKLVGPRVVTDLRTAPAALHVGLQTIAETMASYVEAVQAAGADGLFFATQLATSDWLSPDEYATFGEPYDRLVLEAWRGKGPNILHLHGANTFFELAERYPIQGVSWHPHETAPSLAEALQQSKRCLVTGLTPAHFLQGADRMVQLAREALDITAGRHHILAPECVIPTQVADETLAAVIMAIET